MARAFTTTFLFNQKEYAAVISQINNDVNIYVPDETLHPILPNGKFHFNPDRGLKVGTSTLTETQNLLLTILSAVELQYGTNSKINVE